jgi:hypothetical protein
VGKAKTRAVSSLDGASPRPASVWGKPLMGPRCWPDQARRRVGIAKNYWQDLQTVFAGRRWVRPMRVRAMACCHPCRPHYVEMGMACRGMRRGQGAVVIGGVDECPVGSVSKRVNLLEPQLTKLGVRKGIGDICDLQKQTWNMTVKPSEHICTRGIVFYSN